MKIYVDADACPTVIKDILYRVSQRTGIEVILVANQPLSIPRIPTVRSIQVSQGFDVADNHIVELVQENDLVITADIPLAAEVIDKGGKSAESKRRALHQGEHKGAAEYS